MPANKSLELEIEDILFCPPGRACRKPLVRYKLAAYQAESWTGAQTDRRQGRAPASVSCSPRWLYRDQHDPAEPFGRPVLQQARDRRAMDQGRQAGDPLDAAVVPSVPGQRSAAATERPGVRTSATSGAEFSLPPLIKSWSLTSLQQRLVKPGGRLVKHAHYYWLLLAEGHLHRRLFGDMLRRIWALPAAGRMEDPVLLAKDRCKPVGNRRGENVSETWSTSVSRRRIRP